MIARYQLALIVGYVVSIEAWVSPRSYRAHQRHYGLSNPHSESVTNHHLTKEGRGISPFHAGVDRPTMATKVPSEVSNDGSSPSMEDDGTDVPTYPTRFNAILLTVSFGYAVYTILNIDRGMTRGWTQSEIVMRIPLDTWHTYETSLAEKPIYTKTMINVVIYLLGDWLSQTLFQEKNLLQFDAGRILRNGFIGLCFGPLVHLYYQFSDTVLPLDSWNPLLTRVEKILMDQTIYLTVKASVYVAAVGLLAGESWETAKTNVESKIPGIVGTAWKFWPLVHCLTYSVIPAQHRILWVNCVDLVWNAILASVTTNKSPVTHVGCRRPPAVAVTGDSEVPWFGNSTLGSNNSTISTVISA